MWFCQYANLSGPNKEWSLDCDALATGRTIRVLSIVDNFAREGPALEADKTRRAYTCSMRLHVSALETAFLLWPLTIYAMPSVTKVEPPNWWTGHSLNPVRLLIHGRDLSGATVTASSGLSADKVSVNGNGTYLFVDINIPASAKPGDYPLQIRTKNGSVIAPFRIDAPLDRAGRFQGFSPDDVIYLIIPDRFANGDPANDDPVISRGLYDRKNSHAYHGGDLQGIIDHLPYFKELGVTALWLTPIYDNNNQMGTDAFHPDKRVSDYHGYGAVDYYGVEEHFGDLKLLRKLADEAHRQGIKLIQDQVANHVGPAHPWVADPPTPTWFHGTPTSHLKETFDLWHLIDPHASDQLIRPVLDGWFADALPDLNQEDPEVANYEIQNALWWVGTVGFDGIRQDTLPYVGRPFWNDWSTALKREYPKLQAVGEVMEGNPVITSYFQGGTKQAYGIDSGIDSVFDYPAYYSLRQAFAGGKDLSALTKTIADDRLYPNPSALVTIFGDHDVKRFMSEPGATAEGLKLALAFVLTARGIPVIYYGDELGMVGGDDPDNRRDFPGGWPGDSHDAFSAQGRTPQESDIFRYAQKLTALRARLKPLRDGVMISLTESKQAWAYARRDMGGTVIVALNNDSQAVNLQIPLPGTTAVYRSLLGTSRNAVFHNGLASIELPPRTAEIYAASADVQ